MKMFKLMFLTQVTTIISLLFMHVPSFSSLGSSSFNGSCIASERAALVSIKASLSDPGNQLSPWKGEDCCAWKGVLCSNRTGHVIKLNLRGEQCYHFISNCLGGEISSSLLGLQRLRHLDLSWNNFNGANLPEFVGYLKKLRYLNISNAGFGGRIPPQFGNLSSLVYLDLNSDFLGSLYSDDLQWLSRLSSLKHLDLTQVGLRSAAHHLDDLETSECCLFEKRQQSVAMLLQDIRLEMANWASVGAVWLGSLIPAAWMYIDPLPVNFWLFLSSRGHPWCALFGSLMS